MANFLLHQKTIAAKHCVNKDKPALHCNGKCYMRKMLKKSDKDEKKEEKTVQRTDVHLICQKIEDISFDKFFSSFHKFPSFKNPKITGTQPSVFRPPVFIS